MAKFNINQSEQQIRSMLVRLNAMYDREQQIVFEFKKLEAEWQQLQEDKELLQNMIMFQSNKINRIKNFGR